jgi:DNA primase
VRDERDEIRARIDIVDLVGQKVLLKRAGKHWKGLCPFHDDRSPSFYVSPDIGRYRCWSCGEAGDIFNWVMKSQNVDFGDALRLLAEKAGITLSSKHGESQFGRKERLEIMKLTQGFFTAELNKSEFATQYCEGRGLSEDIRKTWGLGYAPASDHHLATALRKSKVALPAAKELFLVEEDSAGSYFDKFRSRLMFPIHDERGDLIAYGGRILGDGHPKYINSSDTPLFRKSKVLYGMNRAKDSIAKANHAILVEGYLDVIACHQAGLENAVASLGTSLAEEHAKLLRRWCEKVTILYDADTAGIKAADRASEILQAEHISTRIVLLPKGEDPDTMLRKLGAAAVREAAERTMTPSEFQIWRIESDSTQLDEHFWTAIVEALSKTSSLGEMQSLATLVSSKHLSGSRADAESLMQQARQAQKIRLRGLQKGKAVQSQMAAGTPSCNPAEAVLFRAFLEGFLRLEVYRSIQKEPLITAQGQRIAEAILEAFPKTPPEGKPVEWLSAIEPTNIRESLSDCMIAFTTDDQLLSQVRADVSAGELADVLHELQTSRDRNSVSATVSSEPTTEQVQDAFEKLRAEHARQAHLWEV